MPAALASSWPIPARNMAPVLWVLYWIAAEGRSGGSCGGRPCSRRLGLRATPLSDVGELPGRPWQKNQQPPNPASEALCCGCGWITTPTCTLEIPALYLPRYRGAPPLSQGIKVKKVRCLQKQVVYPRQAGASFRARRGNANMLGGEAANLLEAVRPVRRRHRRRGAACPPFPSARARQGFLGETECSECSAV